MVKCSHETCGREHRIWMPETTSSSDDIMSISSTGHSDVSLHHWCIFCGCIQNKTDDHPKKIGFWINVLAKIAQKHRLSQVQKRFVVKELISHEFFEDLYGTSGSIQRKAFVSIMKKCCNLNDREIDSFIF